MRAFVALLLSLLPLSAFGADPYRAVISGWGGACAFEPADAGADWVPQYDFFVAGAAAVAPAPGGRVFAAMHYDASGRGVHVAEIRRGAPPTVVSETIPQWEPLALSVDLEGRMYVLAQPCDPAANGSCSPSGPDAILAFDAEGHAGPIHVLGDGFAQPSPSAIGAMDLAADQCTLFLIQNESVIRRFNVCTGSFLTDFATTSPGITSLRILPDGGVLAGRSSTTDRYTAAGTIARTYPVEGAGAIGLVHGGMRAFIAPRCQGNLIELHLASGSAIAIEEIDSSTPALAIVPYRGWSAALGSHLGEAVPTASTLALALLGIAVVAAALLRLR